MCKKSFKDLNLRSICLETERGDIYGLFTDCRFDINAVPENLIPYGIRFSDDDDSVPATIETVVVVNYFGTILTDKPLDFSGSDYLSIKDWGFDVEPNPLPEWMKKYLGNE